jgi:carboxypeptidase PM20D1
MFFHSYHLIPLTRAIGQGVAVAPYLLSGGTDSKHFAHMAKKIYRFAPYSVNKTAGDLGTIHSTNERVKAKDFTLAICTYARMIELLSNQ